MPITPNKQLAITALLAGASNQDAAKAAGVAPATLCRWKHLPEFATAMAAGQAQLCESSVDDLAALQAKALGAIDDALENDEVNIRLRAAALVMPRNGSAIIVNATAQANAAAMMPELSVEEAVTHILAGPRTLKRAIEGGAFTITPELRTRIKDCADGWAALASGAASENGLLPLPKLPESNRRDNTVVVPSNPMARTQMQTTVNSTDSAVAQLADNIAGVRLRVTETPSAAAHIPKANPEVANTEDHENKSTTPIDEFDRLSETTTGISGTRVAIGVGNPIDRLDNSRYLRLAPPDDY